MTDHSGEQLVDELTGQLVDHYRVLELVGRGGMGVVYKAEDTRLGRLVALKFLPPDVVAGIAQEDATPADQSPHTKALERFHREARAASALNHPNICTVHDIGESDGQPFIVMEYLEGETLKTRLADELRPPLKPSEVLNLALQIADGLIAAHAKGIIHRDIKPANIFVMTHGQVKILDFGLAKLPSAAAADGSSGDNNSLTARGAAVGTFAYMSPEQARSKELDARSDVFSFGLVLYELAEAWQSPAGQKEMAAAGEGEVSIAVGLREVISKALQRDRALRYQNAGEMKADLECFGRTPAARTVSPVAKRWVLALACVMAAGIVSAVYYFRAARKPVLSGKHSVVIGEFSNHTGDPVFDGTLRQALGVALTQSPFLNVLSEENLTTTLQQMEQPALAPLTPELARELCRRAGSEAVINGSISSLGSEYVVELKATNCLSGDSLAQQQATASGKEKVLGALDKAAAGLRGELGESLQSLRQHDTPIDKATTPSFEALQAFTLGTRAVFEAGDAGSIPFLRQAIQLDPNFASAYEALGVAYTDLGEDQLASENLRKAYELRSHASEPERLQIEAHYYDLVAGDLDKARETYQLWASAFPLDATARGNLGVCYARQGDYDRAITEMRRALDLKPHDATWLSNLMNFYLALGRLEEARSTYDEAIQQKADSPYLRFLRYQLAFLQRDQAAMAEQVSWSQGKTGSEDVLLAYESDTQAFYGRLQQAQGLSSQAVKSAERAGEKETAAGWQAASSLREALFGNAAQARSGLSRSLSAGRDVTAAAALALALSGDARASRLADDLARQFPEDTAIKFSYLPAIRGAFAISLGRPQQAVEFLQSAIPYELGYPTVNSLMLNLYPAYVRGLAYLAAREGPQAAAEFQKILGHPGIVVNEPIGALAQLQMARAQALTNNRVAARAAYEAFFDLWKDADSNVPVLKEARTEYAGIKDR
ncbi:MAG TPA: protein kinase [Terriglobia bacterium]|nr:protein kinase [Terriglobia bacterium]